MKKLAIVGASAALAAMPVVGVFAADGTLTYTDTITAIVESACTLSRTTGAGTYEFGTVSLGATAEVTGTVFGVTCNDTGGWKITAVGASEATTATSMDSSTNKDTDDIPTGTSWSSSWGFKLSNPANATIATGYDDYTNIPASAAKVAEGTSTTAGAVTTGYKVGMSSTQSAGTYTGKVTYTLVHPNPVTP